MQCPKIQFGVLIIVREKTQEKHPSYKESVTQRRVPLFTVTVGAYQWRRFRFRRQQVRVITIPKNDYPPPK